MVDTFQPRSLSCFRIRKRRHDNRMDLRRANTPESLNRTWAGERSKHFCSFQSPQMFFLLTLPFIERPNRPNTYQYFGFRPVAAREALQAPGAYAYLICTLSFNRSLPPHPLTYFSAIRPPK